MDEAPAGRSLKPLADLRPGQRGRVASIRAPDATGVRKLMAMGLLPGAEVYVRRRFPSYVFDVGLTQLTVDRRTAREILVEPDAAD